MFKTVTYQKWPRTLPFAEKIQQVDETLRKEFGLRRVSSGFRQWDNSFSLRKTPTENYICDSHKEFIAVITTVPYFESFTWHSTYTRVFSLGPLSFTRFGVGVDFTRSHVEITVHASNDLGFIERAHELVRTMMDLGNPERIDSEGYRRKMLDASVFVARHFDPTSDEYYRRLSTFLELLGFDVKQGEDYTSGAIPEKVKQRIDRQETILVVVSGDRDHAWLVSEASYALGLGKHIVFIVEEGANVQTAIHGKDLEQIRFPCDRIEETFCSLLREFRSVGIKGLFT
jgi:hypothetical protein